MKPSNWVFFSLAAIALCVGGWNVYGLIECSTRGGVWIQFQCVKVEKLP